MQPNITSDVNGQYMGSDVKVHTLGSRPAATSTACTPAGTPIHSLAQLQAILDPTAAGDQAQSLVNYYAQDSILQQWGYLT